MSESDKKRWDNMDLALRLMMQDLGEPYEWQEHDAKTPKFAAVYPTTWDELAERGRVKAWSYDRYSLTGPGWIEGLKVTGKFEERDFKRKAGQLQAALKARVKPSNRQQWGHASRTDLARETGLSEFLIYDAIDSHLLRELNGVIDAHWSDGDNMKNWIDIPPRFGLNELDEE